MEKVILTQISVEELRQIIREELKTILVEFINPDKPEFPEDILDINAAAQFLKISKSTLYKLSSSMEIPRFKKGKRLYFKKSELVNWISEGQLKTTKDIEMEMSRYLSQKKRR